jgi:anion-transporting  ArsA/GET3 family ATPase
VTGPRVGDVVERHRLVVCVGTGGVGKTTVSAAIALGAARRGRRAMVLTIDPARALARALGLDALAPGGETVPAAALAAAGVTLRGRLDAGMLDQKQAWDGFVDRHAPTRALAREILGNPFYRELSTSFSGSTEYVAIEEVCRLLESGRHDLVVLDTPPAAHALDFLRAPERIDRLLDRPVASWLARPYQQLGRGAWRSAGAVARFAVRHLERAAGTGTLREISAFFVALDGLLDDVAARSNRARALLRGGDAALVLVATPRQLVMEETGALVRRMDALDAPLSGVVLNRVHAVPAVSSAEEEAAMAALDAPAVAPEAAAWLRAAWAEALARAAEEADAIAGFAAALPPAVARATIAEAAGDVHTLTALARMADRLWA